jgi:hypothetical protein
VIREALEGSVGSIRTVTANTVRSGIHEGASDEAKALRALETKPRFDIQVSPLRRIGQPLMEWASVGIMEFDVDILVAYHLKTLADVNQTVKEAVRVTVLNDAETIRQALSMPANLTNTSTPTATKIVSGCLRQGAPPEISREDFEEHVLELSMSFVGMLNLTLATS